MLAGKVAVVTGLTSGTGLGIARVLAGARPGPAAQDLCLADESLLPAGQALQNYPKEGLAT